MRKIETKIALFVGFGLLNAFAFQNCSQVEFAGQQPIAEAPSGAGANGTNVPGDSSSNTGAEATPATHPHIDVSAEVPTPTQIEMPTPPPSGMATNSNPPTPTPPQASMPTPPPGADLPTAGCGNQIEVNGKCVDFTCKSVVELKTASDLNSIPARTSEGICYSFKLASAGSNGVSSKFTSLHDPDVVSRNHDGGGGNPSKTHHPYLMASFKHDFFLNGPRVVKLAGGSDAVSPIKVDNFVLAGVYPASAEGSADITKYYVVDGTTDSSIADSSGSDSQSISFLNTLIHINGYGSGGTSSVAPINVTKFATPNVQQVLDVRLEDCGGQAALSDVYIVFQ